MLKISRMPILGSLQNIFPPIRQVPKQSVAKSETFGSKSLACCNLFPLSVKKMHDVWGILAVFTRMQREKEGEL